MEPTTAAPPSGTPPRGGSRAYVLRDGEGEHFLVGAQVATVIARPEAAGELFDAAVLTGGKGATMPPHVHERAHEGLFVLDGAVELAVGGERHLLARGDYASIPPGTVHGHRFRAHRTRALSFATGAPVAPMYAALGAPYGRPVQPEAADPALADAALARAEAGADVRFVREAAERAAEGGEARPVANGALPEDAAPYVLESGEGPRLLVADQLFTVLARQRNTGGRFIVLVTEGPPGAPVPPHLHERHTENFFCLDGHVTMHVAGEEVRLSPGDYVHCPAGTVHSYQLAAPYTRFVGWLTPGLFEPFFEHLGDPYEAYVFPVAPAPFRFDRVLARLGELDVKFLRPPQGGPGQGPPA